MNKIRSFSLSFVSVALIFLAISLSLKADKCDDCATEFNKCLVRCQGLPAGCNEGCSQTEDTCESKNCPVEYTLSNWSTFDLNFFTAKQKKPIGSLTSPGGPMVVQESDFPITAAWAPTCPTLDDPKCLDNDKYRVVIEKGCHVVWYAVHFYTTGLNCGNKTPKGSVKRSSPLPSKSTESKVQGEQKPAVSSQ